MRNKSEIQRQWERRIKAGIVYWIQAVSNKEGMFEGFVSGDCPKIIREKAKSLGVIPFGMVWLVPHQGKVVGYHINWGVGR